jgi:hypothetical protein
MQIRSLYVDYGSFMTPLYDPLAVDDGLLHGHAAPAMSLGTAGYHGLLASSGGA